MPKTKENNLYRLIKSLSKGEKRNFKVFSTRFESSENAKFIQLFDAIDKMKEYDEESIFQKYPDIKRTQLANLKRHLSRQILTSLKQIHKQKNIDIEIREEIDFAKILYNKGLYMPALKALDRVKKIAMDAHEDLLHLQIIEFEKLIESRHITRSISNRADELAQESIGRVKVISKTIRFSNLMLKLYGLYIKMGHAKSEKDRFFVEQYFKSNIPDFELNELTFYEKLYLYHSYVWYYYILQNFLLCYRYSRKWIDLLKENPVVIGKDPAMLMRGYNNELAASFYLGDYERHTASLNELIQFSEEQEKYFDNNTQIMSFLFITTAQLNNYFMSGGFDDGVSKIPEILKDLEKYKNHLDQHRIMVFYYKIASLYFGAEDHSTSLDYLNEIINMKVGSLREDIQCFTRIMHLVAHYEMGHYDLLEYLVKSVYRFLAKMDDQSQILKEILRFLRKALFRDPKDLVPEFEKLRSRLIELSEDPVERRSLLYFDVISWLDSKIEDTTIGDVIRRKFLDKQAAKAND
ncbi:MAG: hypothetical protein KJP00_10595 [Bacteroidia bacterium]|nr:hypothetical protein [Bacteroidia bacterium]